MMATSKDTDTAIHIGAVVSEFTEPRQSKTESKEVVVVGAEVWYGVWHKEDWETLMRLKSPWLQSSLNLNQDHKNLSRNVPACPNNTFKKPSAPGITPILRQVKQFVGFIHI